MNEIAIVNTAESQLIELETTISSGDYSTLQKLLLQQALTLHMLGNKFTEESEKFKNVYERKAFLDVAFKAFGQSLKAMRMVKEMGK